MSHSSAKAEGAWLLPLITNQTIAYAFLLVSGLIVSFIAWYFFTSIGGADLPNIIFWIISLVLWIGPQAGLHSMWQIEIPTQYTAELVIRGQRTGVWLPEGKYIIPFFGSLITLNASEIQHTSKTDVSISDIVSYDKSGEELLISITAEREIVKHSIYEEFDAKTMAINEKEILIGAITRAVQKKKYWTEILGEEQSLVVEDDIFKGRCLKYGIKLSDIVFVIKVKDISIQSMIAKRKRLVEELIKEFKEATGKTSLTSLEMSKINDRVEVLIGKATKQIIDGVDKKNMHYWAGSTPRP